jgi:hypothetical protein
LAAFSQENFSTTASPSQTFESLPGIAGGLPHLVRRVVAKHDNPDTQQLLLSVGSPVPDGFRYPAENILWAMLRDIPIQQLEAQYLERITAHDWESGNIIDIPVVRPQ